MVLAAARASALPAPADCVAGDDEPDEADEGDGAGADASGGVAVEPPASPARRRSRYSSTPRGSIATCPSPSSAHTESVTRSRKYRSWETTTRVPGQPSRKSSSTVRVSMSRSLVGSSSSSTLGSPSSSRSSWKRRRSPPERSPMRAVSLSPVKPNRSSREVALSSPPAVRTTRAWDSIVASTRAWGSSGVTSWVRCARATVRPRRTRPAVGSSAPESSESTEVLPAPLTPTSPTRSPGPRRHVAPSSSRRSPRCRSTSSTSTTSLPSRWVAKRCSSSRSRGGGSSSMSTWAASMRNFGLEVRAGAPRRSHASSLRIRFWRRSSEAAACRCRSALASTNAA